MIIATLRKLTIAMSLFTPLAFGFGCAENGQMGSSKVMSHSESEKTGWFGGKTHEANTTYKNPDGSSSVESETSTTKGNKTTIVREKKTTNIDGTVQTDSETRTIVAGSEKIESESKSTN